MTPENMVPGNTCPGTEQFPKFLYYGITSKSEVLVCSICSPWTLQSADGHAAKGAGGLFGDLWHLWT